MKEEILDRNGNSYRGVILDIDGTLLDSNAAHVRAWVEALTEHGHDVAEDDIWPLVGMGGDNLLPAAVGIDKESEEGKRISERRGEIYKSRYFPHLRPFPQVRQLLERMRDNGLTLVVASSSPEDEVEKALETIGINDLLESATSATDAGRSKPDPDVVRSALERSGLAAREVVMLGDTPYDIQAAGKMDVGVIALRCGGFRDEDLAGAVAVYDDAADLLARWDSSPLGGG
ncbi:MAG TPA: HAD family hydrolase [Thermoanaerobaculia bacterium]|nr:HAD family hydrolase [Thermoanaerobaculia bacterium]